MPLFAEANTPAPSGWLKRIRANGRVYFILNAAAYSSLSTAQAAYSSLWVWILDHPDTAPQPIEGRTGRIGDTVIPIKIDIVVSNDQRAIRDIRDAWPTIYCRWSTNHGRWGTHFDCQCYPGSSQPLHCSNPACTTPVSTLTMQNNNRYFCSTCLNDPNIVALRCYHCGYEVEEPNVWIAQGNPGEALCFGCMDNQCPRCRRITTLGYTDETTGNSICRRCHNDLASSAPEVFDDNSDVSFQMESTPARPIRTCSLELEMATEGSNLAAQLYRESLSSFDYVAEYHTSNGSTLSNVCHVERDSSIPSAGGELIFDRLNLDETDDPPRLYSALRVARSLAPALQTNLRCGVHIHVDAHNFGIGDVRNLVLLTNYIEDPLYRLASAMYTQHRGTEYSQPVDKGPFGDRRQFGVRFFRNNGHRSALNVAPYWESIANCQCGAALVGEHATCECSLGRCTFEFRYFNGTTSMRKLLAYIAICQSLCALAKQLPDVSESDFPPMEFVHTITLPEHMQDEGKTMWQERLTWMLKNLYFSDSERAAIRFTAENCLIGQTLGADKIETIFRQQYDSEFSVEPQTIRKQYRDRRNGTVAPASNNISGLARSIWSNTPLTDFTPNDIPYEEDEF